MPQEDENWGSRAVNGRDWGTSARCIDSSLQSLLHLMEKLTREAGVRDSFDGGAPLMPLSSTSASPFCRASLPLDLGVHHAMDIQLVPSEKGTVRMEIEESPTQQNELTDLERRRRKQNFKKLKRMSVFMAASQSDEPVVRGRQSMFQSRRSVLGPTIEVAALQFLPSCDLREGEEESLDGEPPDIFTSTVLSGVFSFLTEPELLRKASSVCTSWAEAAATAHANLMLAGLGRLALTEYDMGGEDDDSIVSDDDDDDESLSARPHHRVHRNTIAESMEKSWASLLQAFPFGQFLSEGGFKKVYKVYNATVGQEEAVSVM